MTKTEQIAWLRGRADIIEATGDLALATEARAEANEIEYRMSHPVAVPVVAHRCDSCQRPVTGKARIDHYADVICVDWVLCATCDGRRFTA
jgi:hypothetical protein